MRKTIEKIKERKGITLIALVVTIVVILILAGITVGIVTSDNGILKETKNAKQQAEIDNEKSIVERAKMLAMMRSRNGAITYEIFEPAIKDEAGKMSTDVSDAGDTIEVLFTESNRYYEIDQDGNVSEPQEVQKDENAGDITKGGRCDGSEEKPYEISCIEDLVALSNMTNGTGIKLENGQAVTITGEDTFQNKNVILTRNLNFKSKYSYENSQRTDFGNLNNDDTDGNGLMTEMTTGTGFMPIGEQSFFRGNFDGKEHTISNIFIEDMESGKKNKALFAKMAENSSVMNLTITGKIKSDWKAAGIVGAGMTGHNIKIINCINKANIIGYNTVGGIAGDYIQTIENCKNYGTIEITGNDLFYAGAGGILGTTGNNRDIEVKIENCSNYGEIKGIKCTAGIVGTSPGKTLIENCRNEGIINNLGQNSDTGGIIAWQSVGTLNIINSYNLGTLKGNGKNGGIIGSIAGYAWNIEIKTNISNSYNAGEIELGNICGGLIGLQGTSAAKNYLYINNSYDLGKIVGKQTGNIVGVITTDSRTDTKTEFTNVYYPLDPAIGTGSLTSGEATLKTETEIKSQAFVDLLNSNIGTNTDWKKWKLGNDGYPTFAD